MPRVIGLTGGIASGKSTAAARLRELGAEVIDADEIARAVVAPGQPALEEIVGAFGVDVLAADGTLDRKRVGARIFADPALRVRLNAMTHPRIAAESARRIEAAGARGAAVVVYEAALLVENGIHRGLDGLIVVAVPLAVQLERLMARDGLPLDEARQRLAAQLPLADKIAVADFVIDNSGSPAELSARVAAMWSEICAGAPTKPRARHEQRPSAHP